MNMIGKFQQTEDGYSGSIHTLNIQEDAVTLTPIPASADGRKKPDYSVAMRGAQVGAAWKSRSKAGKDYLRLKIDDPTLAQPIFANLVGKDADFSLFWGRS